MDQGAVDSKTEMRILRRMCGVTIERIRESIDYDGSVIGGEVTWEQ